MEKNGAISETDALLAMLLFNEQFMLKDQIGNALVTTNTYLNRTIQFLMSRNISEQIEHWVLTRFSFL